MNILIKHITSDLREITIQSHGDNLKDLLANADWSYSGAGDPESRPLAEWMVELLEDEYNNNLAVHADIYRKEYKK